MKRTKRLVALVLSLLIAVGGLPLTPAFAEEAPYVVLETERVGIDGLDESGTYFTMGNAQTITQERGRYALTVYRDGDTSMASSVDVATVDISAVYGKDYIMDDSRYPTTVTPVEGTIIQHFGDEEYLEATKAAIAELQEMNDALEEAGESQEGDSGEALPQSSLAALKEAQTGHATRETYEAADTVIFPDEMNSAFDVGQQVETSSTTTVTFAPGETEKQVIFQILEDQESEGQELINFMLTNPVDAGITEPFTTTILIQDDEPVVHPVISFAAAEFTAQDGVVTVTARRSEPLYSYVTAVVTTSDGTAVAGVNYKATQAMIEFLPYQEETTFEIDVAPAEGDTAFTVTLSDLKGGDEGEVMTATVVIPGDGAGTAVLAGMPDTVTLPNGTTYMVRAGAGSNQYYLYSETQPNENVGIYYDAKGFSYGHFGGYDTNSKESRYDEKKECGYLRWYNWKAWNKGWSTAEMTYNPDLFQSLFLDFESKSGNNDMKHGFDAHYNGPGSWGGDMRQWWGGTNARAVRGPVIIWHTESYQDGNQTQTERKPNGNSGHTTSATFEVIAERTTKELYEPEMWFYGAIALYKQFRITVKSPDPVELKTPTGTREARPAAVSTQKREVYLDGTVTFTVDVAAGESMRLGQLAGYEITCGDGPNAKKIKIYPNGANKNHYLSQDGSTITFNTSLIRLIEDNVGKVQKRSDGNGYYTNLYIKPLFNKIPVRVDVLPAEDNKATFNSPYLKKSSTDQLFIGDEIDMSMTANPGEVADNYALKQFINPGDTAPVISSDATNYQENKSQILTARRYEFKPILAQYPNHISVTLDAEAARYFTVNHTFRGTDELEGRIVLNTDETGDTEKSMPVTGRAYKIEVVPKEGVTVPAGYRPIITNVYNPNIYVNGYGMDILAQAAFSQNVYKVTVQKNSGEYKYFALTGKAMYDMVPLLDNSKPMTREPASNNQVYAGNWIVDAHDKNGKAIKSVTSVSAITKEDGSFDVAGIRAVPGDCISAVIKNNNVDQVVYFKVNSAQKQSRTFYELTGWNSATNENTFTQVTKECLVMNTGSVAMPVRTLYAPYVRTVNIRYSKKDVRDSSTVDIYEQDVLEVKAYLETNKQDIHTVEFILYDKSGQPKAPVEAVRKNFNGSGDTKPAAYTYRALKNGAYWSAGIPGSDLVDGDTLHVRIIGEKQMPNGTYIDYPTMSVGVTFVTPPIEPFRQQMFSDMSQANASKTGLPLIGDLAGSMDSGNFIWKVTYQDPTNMGRSPYVRTVGMAVDVYSRDPFMGSNWFHTNDFKMLRDGIAMPPMVNYEQYAAEKMRSFDPDREAATLDQRLVKAYEKQAAKKVDPSLSQQAQAQQKQDIARNLYKEQAKKDSLDMIGGLKVGVSAKVMLQFQYAYDATLGEHVFVGGQWLVAGTVYVNKTFYWIICGVPVFVDVTGIVSLQVDGSFYPPDKKEKSSPITQEEINAESNVLDARFRNPEGSVPWTTLTCNLIVKPGVGFCGILDAHGTLSLTLMIRWVYMSPDQYKKRAEEAGIKDGKSYGVMVNFSGGVGVSLLVIKIEFTLGTIKRGWGLFDTDGVVVSGPEPMSDDDPVSEAIGFTASLQSLEVGTDRDAQGDASLMSTLKQIGTKVIRENTGELINPQAVLLGDSGDVFVTYLGSDTKRDAINAPALKYMIRDAATGKYSDAKIVDDNGAGDVTPALLLDSQRGKVYVAWSSAETKFDSFQNLDDQEATPELVQKVKDNLNKLDIYLKAYDIATGTWGDTVRVTDDAYVDSDVRLVQENEGIALYYFKRDLTNINKAEDLASVTQNYTAWAKKVYLPETNTFAELGNNAKADADGNKAGDAYTQQVIEFVHPTVQDPLVLDLSADGFTYDGTAYSLYLYSVDTDGKLDTSADHQIWLQVTNLDQNKRYYPVLLDSDQKDVAAPQLSRNGDELYISWVRNSSTLNLIDARDFMDNLSDETIGASTLKDLYAGAKQEQVSQRFWYRDILQNAADAQEDFDAESGLAGKLLADEFPVLSRDFGQGSEDDVDREENPISGYRLLVGNDGNLYLFWTATARIRQGEETSRDEQSILYASTYFKPDEQWKEKYGEETGSGIFGDPVAISDTGVMIDELSAVVGRESATLLLGNTYTRTYKEPVEKEDFQKDPYVNGPHSLQEFEFKPVGSLSVEDLTLSDDFPKEGEEVTFSWTLKNAGLLPAIGRSVKLQVLNGTTEIWKYEDEVKAEPLYVGETVAYQTDAWKVPAGLDMNKVMIQVTATELDENGKPLENETAFHRQLSQAADVAYLEPYVENFSDWASWIYDYLYATNADLTYDPRSGEEPTTEDVLAYVAALKETLQENAPDLLPILEEKPLILSDVFDYLVYLPVANFGNKTANLTAKIRFVDDELEETEEILGESLSPIQLAPVAPGYLEATPTEIDEILEAISQIDYLAIPMKLTKDHFDAYGIARGTIDVYDGDEKVLEKIEVTIYADGVVDFTMKDAGQEITLKRGTTYQIQTEAYPYAELQEMVYLSSNPDVATVNESGRVTAVGKGEAYIVVSELGSGKDRSIAVKVTDGILPEECPQDDTCPMAAFPDLTLDKWYHDGVHWALDNGVMNGVSKTQTRFNPDGNTTRAQLVTMLWRMEGEPASNYAGFKDIKANSYYATAVRWAAEHKIVTGYEDGTFRPDVALTREQLATILYRYAQYQGVNVDHVDEGALNRFTDAAKIQNWAKDGANWAVRLGIINGMEGRLFNPQGVATRAQVATMLMRYDTSV